MSPFGFLPVVRKYSCFASMNSSSAVSASHTMLSFYCHSHKKGWKHCKYQCFQPQKIIQVRKVLYTFNSISCIYLYFSVLINCHFHLFHIVHNIFSAKVVPKGFFIIDECSGGLHPLFLTHEQFNK